MEKFVKQKRQIRRKFKNMSKSIILDTKKECNRLIKKAKKEKNESRIRTYTNLKNKLLEEAYGKK